MRYNDGVNERWRGPVVALAVLGAGLAVRTFRARTTPHLSASGGSARVPGPPAFGLREASREAGLLNTHAKLRVHGSLRNIEPLLATIGGAAAAVVDYDGDGFQDVFLTNTERGVANRLYRNTGDGRFVERTEEAGLAEANAQAGAVRALFFDADFDGDPDLFLQTSWCPKFYRNDGGRFVDRTAASGLTRCAYAFASNVLDYDGDGDLDLFVGEFYRQVNLLDPERYDFMWENGSAARNGGPLKVYRNDGGGRFTPVDGDLGIRVRGFTMALGVYDLRGSGRRDLYVAADYGGDALFLNEGGGRFVDATERIPKGNSHSGMSAEIAEVDPSGEPFVFVTDDHSPGRDPAHNVLWRFGRGGAFENVGLARGVGACGFSWGAKFVDLDNDGLLDLFVSNGLLSANPHRHYEFEMDVLVGTRGRSTTVDPRGWPPMEDSSLSGFQEDCVFRNTGAGFEDVTARTGVRGDLSDGRGVAAIDVLGDGAMSLVVANQGQPLRFYRNAPPAGNAWIGFDLRGAAPNRDAWGARVEVRLHDGRRLTRRLHPANGFLSQSDPRLHFGLGPGARIAGVRVTWPRGATRDLGAPRPGRYHLVREDAGGAPRP